MKKRLSTDASLRPLVAQYVPISFDLDADQAEWQAWRSKYPPEGNTIPMVFVVRGDGEMLYGQSGSFDGNELKVFLAGWRSKTGTILNSERATELAEKLAEIKKHHEDGDASAAVREIAKFPGGDSYAAVLVEAKEFAGKLIEEAKAKLAEADEQLAESSTAFDGALKLTGILRAYKPMAEIHKEAKKLRVKHIKEQRDVITQAEQLDAAIALEQQDSPERAMRTYQAVARQFPDSPAATIANESIARLEASGVQADAVADAGTATPSDDPQDPPASVASDEDLTKAKSYLKFAQQLFSKNPSSSRKYCERVIEAAPDSDEARQAKELLKRLP